MREIRTQLQIHAPRQRIWEVLMNFTRYRYWNPFIRHIEGVKQSGQRLKVRLHMLHGKQFTMRPKVLVVDEGTEFRWKGSLGIPGLFDGEHYFRLEDAGDDKTTFIHGERFSGLLVPFMKKTVQEAEDAFLFMNEALKDHVETPQRHQ